MSLLLASCTPATETVAPPLPSTSTSTTLGTTTTDAGTTTSVDRSDPVTQDAPETEVLVPSGSGPYPAVVLAHGGGWVAGGPLLMRELAGYLTRAGYLTVNTSYTLGGRDPSFPAALDDIACAVRQARSHPDSDGTVAALGHSSGAHLAAVVALTGDDYAAACPYPGSGRPDRLIGLAGPYDVRRLGPVMLPFFGAPPAEEPDAWEAGNPMLLVEENTGLLALLLHGDQDEVVSVDFNEDFGAALLEAGSGVTVMVLPGLDHSEIYDPDDVGDIIVDWLMG